jgi:hypothetical protein
MKKTLLVSCTIFITALLITACSKDGDTGPEGPKGIDGNANVVQYTFPTHNFAVAASAFLGVTTTADTMNQSAWYVYLIRSSGNVYPIPGFGLNGTSEYRVFWSHSAGKVNFSISRVSGSGEEYSSIRIIRLYANSSVPGGRKADINFNDYYEVCRYYGLASGE